MDVSFGLLDSALLSYLIPGYAPRKGSVSIVRSFILSFLVWLAWCTWRLLHETTIHPLRPGITRAGK
jgi:hypothetical protein